MRTADSPAPSCPISVGESTRSTRRVMLVLYEPTAAGRAALEDVAHRAEAESAPLVVLSVTPHERVDVGCARCRQGAAIWNIEMAEVATGNLAEAQAHLKHLGLEADAYVVRRGDTAAAVADAAFAACADIVVVPWERARILGLFHRRPVAGKLASRSGFAVRVGPRP